MFYYSFIFKMWGTEASQIFVGCAVSDVESAIL